MIFSQTQTTLKKVVLNLRDSSGDLLTCTLWESHAIKFLNCYNNQLSGKTMVMILTHARVKEGQGKYPPSLINS
ncbi:putative nucleic acid-binding protein [Lupinus albus]|uniref:Putative nucleic acid-binding protein n=1 Tax=Lupinus albus TaxID=3870 RepID=A0A6A4QF95_LUPAL|nr:putative nucleic acid-binding protein [Lupinus albus]